LATFFILQYDKSVRESNGIPEPEAPTQPMVNDTLGTSAKNKIHSEFEYLDWKNFIETKVKFDLQDRLFARNVEAVRK